LVEKFIEVYNKSNYKEINKFILKIKLKSHPQ